MAHSVEYTVSKNVYRHNFYDGFRRKAHEDISLQG